MPKYVTLSDQELLSLLCDDDHAAYTEVYNRYSGMLYVHAYRRIRDREEARDLIHELFTALWYKRDQLVLKTSLSGYLYQSVRNRVIDRVQSRQREHVYMNSLDILSCEVNNTDHTVRHIELHSLIEKEIDALPEKMKLVFRLSRHSYMSHKEISEELCISELTVRKQIQNALKVLKPKLSKLLVFFF